MSPSVLHPRSRQTLSLFTTTLAVSFLVIGMPHILPCPAPRAVYAESATAAADGPCSNGKPTTGRRRLEAEDAVKDTSTRTRISPRDENEEMSVPPRAARECPVPKPTGLLGQVLGFRAQEEVKRKVEEEK